VRQVNAPNFGNGAITVTLKDFDHLAEESGVSHQDTTEVRWFFMLHIQKSIWESMEYHWPICASKFQSRSSAAWLPLPRSIST